MLKEVVVAGGTRTAIGGFSGTLAEVSAPALGSVVIKAALARAGVAPDQVDEVIFGNVLSAGLGQNVARQASIGAGLAPSVGATTVNKVCGSGLKAVMLAAQAIQCGDAQVVVAGGTENMSAAPYLLQKARNGYRMGNGELIDSMIRDGLWDVYNNLHMGICGDRCAAKYEFSRQQQDDFAVASYQRALNAQKDGIFANEIVPVEIASRKGTVKVDQDEEPRALQRGEVAGAEAGLRQGGHGDGRQRLEHQRRRGGHRGALRREGQATGRATAGQDPRLQHLLARAGVVHAGAHRRHRAADEEIEPGCERRRPVRDQRGVLGGAHGGHEGPGHSAREGERARRRGGAGPSHRGQRDPRAGDVAERHASAASGSASPRSASAAARPWPWPSSASEDRENAVRLSDQVGRAF